MVTRYLCPFCDWYHDDEGPSLDAAVVVTLPISASIAERISAVVKASMNAHVAKVDAILEAHVDSHVLEMIAPG